MWDRHNRRGPHSRISLIQRTAVSAVRGTDGDGVAVNALDPAHYRVR
jgi:hypothetical protein